MKRVAAAALLAFLPGLARGQALTGHVPRAMVHAAHKEFWDLMNTGGAAAVSNMLQTCYFDAVDNRKRTIQCMVEDIAAQELDHGMRNIIIGMGRNDPGPASSVLSDKAFTMRMQIYGGPIFGSGAAIRSYMGNAPTIVSTPDRSPAGADQGTQ